MGVFLVLLLVYAMTSSVCDGAPTQGGAVCPAQCVCDTRPWYTPQSVYHQARTVDCNELHLDTLPPDISPETQVLLLQSNNISSISRELESLTNLTELDLSQNHFTQVGAMGLSSLLQLVTLYLEENQVEGLQEACLEGLVSLEELYINHNLISSIAPGAFRGLGSLLRLHLNSNLLSWVDGRWFEPLPSLEILMLGENPLLGLGGGSFRPLARLHSLVLAGAGLQELPPPALQGLESLESLSLYGNLLRSVPREALAVLPSLKFLDLNRNPIGRIRRCDFQNLLHLEELSLNNMEELSLVEREAFQNLPQLVKLEMNNNLHLSYIHPLAFSEVVSLRSLHLHGNQLSLLPRELLPSLSSLEELSLHSNPLRCDCLATWGLVLGNQSQLTLLEASGTLCSSPSQLIGQELHRLVFGGGANSCLPLISPHAFPPIVNVSAGQPITLECWATADPAPLVYWVTPTGDKVTSEPVAAPMSEQGRVLASRRHRVTEPGSLVIDHVEPADAGMYTCVAWNTEGADTRSVSVYVDSQEVWPDSPSPTPLMLLAKVVRSHSVLLQWRQAPPKWGGATVHIDSPDVSYTVQVPVDLKQYNVTHLLPDTPYRLCLSVFPPASPTLSSCLNVTTREGAGPPQEELEGAGPPQEEVGPSRASVVLAAWLASAFALLLLLLLVVVSGRRVGPHALKEYVQQAAAIPLAELYPPLITLWEHEADKEKEQIDTSKTSLW